MTTLQSWYAASESRTMVARWLARQAWMDPLVLPRRRVIRKDHDTFS